MSEPSGNTGELGGTATPAERDPAFANQMRRTTALMVLKPCERWLVAARQHMDARCYVNAKTLACAASHALRGMGFPCSHDLQARFRAAMDRADSLIDAVYKEWGL